MLPKVFALLSPLHPSVAAPMSAEDKERGSVSSVAGNGIDKSPTDQAIERRARRKVDLVVIPLVGMFCKSSLRNWAVDISMQYRLPLIPSTYFRSPRPMYLHP